jgi:hypothetical protein
MTGSGEIPNSKTQASHKLPTPIFSRKQRATAGRIGTRQIPLETVITGLIGAWSLFGVWRLRLEAFHLVSRWVSNVRGPEI